MTFLHTAASPGASYETVAIPRRQLHFPDFDQLAFDVYQTSHMYLVHHMTSDDAIEHRHWPEYCFEMGWEKYYSADYEDRNWKPVMPTPITPIQHLSVHPACCAWHYGPAAFEGTKAYISAKNRIVLFRPEENGRRLQNSAARLLMPKVPIDMFVESVAQTAVANREFIPPFCQENWAWETRNSKCLYIRPLLFGHGPQLGVRPAKDHAYVVYSSPVRTYYPASGMRVLITHSFHRAAPGGTGNVKASANYISGLLPTQLARRGFDWQEGRPVRISDEPFHDVLYLDAVHNRYLEEFSGANFMAVDTSGVLVDPQSESILPGITRASIVALADSLGIKVEHRPLGVDEIFNKKKIAEILCAGNAAVVTPIAHIHHNGKMREFDLSKLNVTRRLWDALVGIQLQMREDEFGWVKEVG
ncbi:MAG: branched-chain-amino-acid transaminase [bacterium]